MIEPNATAQQLFVQLNQLDESSTIGAKTGSEIDKSIMETVYAFTTEPGIDLTIPADPLNASGTPLVPSLIALSDLSNQFGGELIADLAHTPKCLTIPSKP